jgi:hypothetical protein
MMYSESAQPIGNVQFEEEQQPTHLMRGAIRGHQRPSEVIRGHQWSSEPSEALREEQPQPTHLSPPAESVVRLKPGAGQ